MTATAATTTATVNPLTAMKIKTLVGFKQITPGVLPGEALTALKQCGVTCFSGIQPNNSVMRTGSMTLLGNTFYGLQMQVAQNKYTGTFTMTLLNNAEDLKTHALQVGFRLTQSAVVLAQANTSVLSLQNNSTYQITPVSTTTEDTSVYGELVLGANTSGSSGWMQLFINKQQVFYQQVNLNSGYPQVLTFGGSFAPTKADGYSLMVGDIYIAELDYNSDKTVTPQLLGNLTLEPFTVESYSGDKHTNTKNQDIVTALNTLNPNNDMGVLAIKPVEQPASVTMNTPDIAGRTILGASLNIVYKDSIAPNNRLRYQITEGTTALPAETITERNADTTGYTTFSKILTAPAGGGAWNADNLKFKLDMVNSSSE
ncbi:TPA: hypothetical protein I8Y21_002518 [Klebsiella oxytoca]|uniref:Uncharacterized protein n=1 Tax=Klebsiella oxytoca TaxID=571 RepID=A0AAN5RDS1_KLEOX|nr:hypothetical protein [Klebsiella oxytoca]